MYDSTQALSLSPSDYSQEVLTERNLNGLCGYPVCSNPPRNDTNPQRKKNSQLSQKKIRSNYHNLKVNASQQEPKFCSQECHDRSHYYLNSVLKESMPLRPLALSNNKKLANNHRRIIHPEEEILLFEELNHQPIDKPNSDGQLQPIVPLEENGSSSQQHQEYSHDFLQPFLTQFQSTLHLNDKRIDPNLNPIFSSIKIIEHAPKLTSSSSSSSDPFHSSDHLNKLEHRVLNQRPTLRTSSPAKTLNSPRSPKDHNPIHEISSSLTRILNTNLILSNSNPGAYTKRRLINGSTHPTPSSSEPCPPIESSVPSSGALEAHIIYNVGSVEDQVAIDQAMALRDELNLNTNP